MIPIGTNITYIINGNPCYEPLYWFLLYFAVISIEFTGRKSYFRFLNVFALLILLLVILYVIVSSQHIQLHTYIPTDNQQFEGQVFRRGIRDMMPILPIAGWYYFGIEIMPLISDEVKNVRMMTLHL
jgi:L-asparagine transporter-like permease